MEVRHVLSEPRIKSAEPGNLVWLVDIFRKGVPDPIDTIEVSDETLPPRKKRGKVAWRLPTDDSRLVCHNVMSRFTMDLFLSCSWLFICASLLDMLLDVFCFHLLSDAILVCNMNYI